jgi:NAD(P)-dependent dehydrogenase (short-subunit alcohol dehydrogenase family)
MAGASLGGRHIVVTGSGGGLGAAVVTALAGAGAVVHAPRRADLDTSNEESVRVFYGALPTLWASIHLVGGFSMGALTDTTLADVRAQWEMNFATAFLCTREAARRIRATSGAEGGRIVNVAARAALVPTAHMAAYASSKAAVVALTQSAAAELKSDGILVNAVAPSIIDTPQNRADMPTADFSTWPKAAEIALTILWLCAPENALTSGAVVPVFGRA